MEVKINREIRNYSESMFFGLSFRQFLCSLLACGIAVLIYFIFRKKLGLEITSWLCILGALPFAAIGFIKYNGMNMEDIIVAFIRSEILTPKELIFQSNNFYYKAIEQYLNNNIKEELKKWLSH